MTATHTVTPRDHILRASGALFRQRGYRNTSMADLAAATGLTKGAFYHHFSDKAAVMEAVLAEALAWSERVLAEAALPDDGDPLSVAALTSRMDVISAALRKLLGPASGGCLIGNTVLEMADVDGRFEPTLKAFFDVWIGALAALATAAGRADGDSFARRTIAEFEGGILLDRLYGGDAHFEAAIEGFRQNLLAQ